MKLVLVHGRDQQGKDSEVLKADWVNTLKKGLENQGLSLPGGLAVAFPYYGDELDRIVRAMDVPLGDEIRTKGGDIDAEYQEFRGRMLEEIRKKAGVTDAQVNAEYGPNPRTKGPQNWEWVQAILRALDRHLPGAGSAAIETFTRDVYIYLTNEAARDKINAIVSRALTDDATVVVGHSLGSVVAYDVLRREAKRRKVPLYLTVGSPLGVELIRENLRPIGFPKPAVADWYNAYDERDVVALYPLDEDNFDLSPDKIENYNSVKNHTKNRHGIIGYLDDRAVAKRIHTALTG